MAIELGGSSAPEMDGPQRRQLEEALLSAFPYPTSLVQLTRERMKVALDEIAVAANPIEVVPRLVSLVEAKGRLEEFVQVAYVQVPGDPLLYAFAQQPRFRRTFLPGYDCDVFISCADDVDPQWLEELCRRLRVDLVRRFGHPVCFGEGRLPAEAEGIARGSADPTLCRPAILLILLSHGYGGSPRCEQELRTFLDGQASGEEVNGRLFVVEYEEVDREDRPAALRHLREYQLWRTTGSEFFYRFQDLKSDLDKQLRALREQPAPGAGSAPEKTAPTPLHEPEPLENRAGPVATASRPTLGMTTARPIELFYSYSHKDARLRDKLETHLAMLQREGMIRGWHDRKITAGSDWKGAIDTNLERAQMILLLVSADFLASDYCFDVEMTRALERHREGEARVIPVILRDVDWSGAPFRELQALPTEGKAVTGRAWRNQDEAFADVVRGIRRVVPDLASPTDAASRGVLFLAETREDLDPLREEVRRYLDMAGFTVLPDVYYPRGPKAFQEAMDRDLERCSLFVQLLDASPGRRTADLPRGYVGLQYDRAMAAGMRILQWRPPSLDLTAVTDVGHLALLDGPDVHQCPIEEFKETVVRAVLQAETTPPETPTFVFINTDERDESEVERVLGKQLLDRGLSYSLPLRSPEVSEVRKYLEAMHLECDVLFLVYGMATPQWVAAQFRLSQQFLHRRKRPLRTIALYDGPPPDKAVMPLRHPHLRFLNCRQSDAELRRFLDEIRRENAS